jgi:hypothetical protein
MEIKIKLAPFEVPQFVNELLTRPVQRQDGISLKSRYLLADIEAETLSELCDQFRHDVFMKAGKVDPKRGMPQDG